MKGPSLPPCLLFVSAIALLAVPRQGRAQEVPRVPESTAHEPPARGAPEASKSTAEAEDDPPGYRTLIDDGVREYDLGNFAEARALFLRAHALYPSARTHRGIGKAEFELRSYEAAIAQLSAALRSLVRPLTPELRNDAEKLMARARVYLAQVVLSAQPADAEIRVDGAPVTPPPNGLLTLTVGNHAIEARAPGHEASIRRITLRGGETQTVAIVLSRAAVGLPSLQPEPMLSRRHDPPSERRVAKRAWLWATLGVVVAGAAAGTVLALRRGGGDRVVYDRGSFDALGKAP